MGAGSNLGGTQTLQPPDAPRGQHCSELTAQREHPSQAACPSQPSSTPRQRWGIPIIPRTSLLYQSHHQQPLGSSSRCFAVSVPPLGLISAHLLQLIVMPQTQANSLKYHNAY